VENHVEISLDAEYGTGTTTRTATPGHRGEKLGNEFYLLHISSQRKQI
jgi:hypothetical protein